MANNWIPNPSKQAAINIGLENNFWRQIGVSSERTLKTKNKESIATAVKTTVRARSRSPLDFHIQ